MGLTHWIFVFVFVVVCCLKGGLCGDLYLQPQGDHAFFSEESFFVSCNSYKKEPGASLVWKDPHSNPITSTSGRIHVDNTIDETGLALVFENLKVEDEGIYSCSLPNDAAQNASFKLTIYETIDFQDTPPVQEAKENEDFTLGCEANPTDKTHVSWIINGQSPNENPDKYLQTSGGLLIKDVNSSDTGFYTCRAIIITPKKSQMKELQIQLKVKYGPRWLKNYMQAEIRFAPLGKPVNLTCEAEGEPHPTFKWSRANQESIGNNHPYFKIFEDKNNSILQINLNNDTLGDYSCQAISPLSNITRKIEVVKGDPPKKPTISLNRTREDTIIIDIAPEKATPLTIKEYKVNITNKDSLDEIRTFEPFEDFVLRNLTEGRYFIKAAAMNDAGYGEYSPIIEVDLKIKTAEHSTVNAGSPPKFALGLELIPLFMIWLARI